MNSKFSPRGGLSSLVGVLGRFSSERLNLSSLLEKLSLSGKKLDFRALIRKDREYWFSLHELLIELSLEIKKLPPDPGGLLSIPSNIPELLQQVDRIDGILGSSRGNSLTRLRTSSRPLTVGDTDLLKYQSTLRRDFVELAQKIENLAQMTDNKSFEAFYYRLLGYIAVLNDEESQWFSDPDSKNGGGDGGGGNNGSGCGSNGFPGPNPKLMSGNRSMPWPWY